MKVVLNQLSLVQIKKYWQFNIIIIDKRLLIGN